MVVNLWPSAIIFVLTTILLLEYYWFTNEFEKEKKENKRIIEDLKQKIDLLSFSIEGLMETLKIKKKPKE